MHVGTSTRWREDVPRPPTGGPKSQKQCTFFAAGTCRFGDACRDKHGGGGGGSGGCGRSPSEGGRKKKTKNGQGKGKSDKKPAAAAPAASILKAHVPLAAPGSVALAASYDHGPAVDCRSWLLDTGCKYDLTTRASVPPHLQDSIMSATVPITLSTANDLANGDQVVRQQIGELGEIAEPYLLESTPTSYP